MEQNNLSEWLGEWNKIEKYSQWMYSTFEKYIGKRVLDIGAGIGNITAQYIDKKELVVATDIFENQIEIMNQRFQKKPYFKAELLDILEDDISKLKEQKFDTIICINVLEHLKDDKKALLRMKEILSPEGHIILIVPAFSKLYCYMDKNVSHYRRYDKGMIAKLAKQCNLDIVKNKYFNFFGIIPYYVKGKFGTFGGGGMVEA